MILKWFQKIRLALESQQRKKGKSQAPQSPVKGTSTLNIKMKTVYPREELSARYRQRKMNTQLKMNDIRDKAQPERINPDQDQDVKPIKRKQKFQPTEMVSPIFGQQVKRKERREPVSGTVFEEETSSGSDREEKDKIEHSSEVGTHDSLTLNGKNETDDTWLREEVEHHSEPEEQLHTQASIVETESQNENVVEERAERLQETPIPVQKADQPLFSTFHIPQPDEHADKGNQDLYATGNREARLPSLDLLNSALAGSVDDEEQIDEKKEILRTTLAHFNVDATVIGAVRGPSVTRYEIQPAPGVKVNKITNLSDDLKLSLAAKEIRIEAPIPGRSAIGIEVPNDNPRPVFLREVLEHPEFKNSSSPLTIALGVDISGQVIMTDIKKMPHGLIAGATGSGKSVCMNTIILSLLYKASPDQVKLLLIDPKMVELAPYHELPHLVTPVVTDPKQATAALKWAVQEMERRYELFSQNGVRDIERYNELMKTKQPDLDGPALPYIVVMIDELADLMMVAPQDVEEAIARIAQKARACGIHLLMATQRPSVDVITGLIKANVPTRLSFAVSSQTDSRTILDTGGAEKLLGRGDMLFLPNGSSKPIRVQGVFVADDEIERVTAYVRRTEQPHYLFEKEQLVKEVQSEQEDELFEEAVLFCVEQGHASASSLQRRFRIGYNRAARLIDMMVEQGYISEQSGRKARDVLVSREELENHS
ncbi:MAG: DNA translocase FtsK [Bacillaceae bacterium]|nr:DNA translocase FtsK [Bacillaceae bacterium]